MRPEYDVRGGVRGKYLGRYTEGTDVVLLVAAREPNAATPTRAAVVDAPSTHVSETNTMTGYVGDIERDTLENTDFRRVLQTGAHSQLVVMSLQPGEEIGSEVHANIDQFFRIEVGEARFVLDGAEHLLSDGGAVVVPAGTRHNVINASEDEELKLYTIYSPPQHPAGTIHRTKAEADASEHH